MILLWAAFGWETQADPATLVAGGGIEMAVELWRATIDNALVEDISDHLVDGIVELNVDRTIKLAASFTLRDPDVVTPYSDYLAPFLRLTYDDGTDALYQQLGLFYVSVPPGTYSPDDAVATFEGGDLTAVLAADGYTDTDNVAAATVIRTEIVDTLAESGITRSNLPASTSTLTTAASYPPGTSRLDKINNLLAGLGWYHLGMDLDGRVSTPGAVRELRYVEPFRTLTDGDLLEPVQVTQPGQPPYNVVVVVNDNATAAPLSSTATNDDASSPTSTVNIGRRMRPPITVQGQTTQAALDALAVRYLAESRSYYEVARIRILPDPDALIAHQTVDLDLTGEQEVLSGRWWVRIAKIGFTPSTVAVDMEINRVTDNITSRLI